MTQTQPPMRVLVTAGAQGIGQAISQRFIEAGAHLAIHYQSSREQALALVAEAEARGVKAIALAADLTKPDEAAGLSRKAVAFLGGLDVLVNNAGSMVERRLSTAVDSTYWDYVFALNVRSAQQVTQAALPALCANAAGAIINIASIAGRKGGGPGGLAYSAAKGALLAWTRALANELGGQGVRVNALAPGLILNTEFHATHSTAEAIAKTIQATPLQKAGTPDDVARAVLFLANERTGFISGATLDVNGGIYCA